jgi:hypothetical protein
MNWTYHTGGRNIEEYRLIACNVGQVELLDEQGLGWLAICDGGSDYVIALSMKVRPSEQEKTCIRIPLWNKRMTRRGKKRS